MRERSTEALLFDLGGVVFDVDFGRAFRHWAQCAAVPVETLIPRFRVDAPYERHEKGQIGADEYFDALRGTLGIEISNEEFAAGWNSVFADEPAQLAELLKSLGAQVPIYAFSNTNFMHQKVWTRRYRDTLSTFRAVFSSCDLGLRKPEKQAFNRVSSAIGVRPEKILFFDDTMENVDGARVAGMTAVHVRDVNDIRTNVTRFLP